MDNQYKDLIRLILLDGEERTDRTGTGTKSIFGHQMKFDLRFGFPAQTTKKLFFTGVVDELLWFLGAGKNNGMWLKDLPVRSHKMWKPWVLDNGTFGPIYGQNWRNWDSKGIDQIKLAINTIKRNPDSRRIIVNAWNVSDIPSMALPPCHTLFQLYVTKDDYLDLQLYQRSGDCFLGIPVNIASYSLLLSMIAQVTNKKPRYFIHTLGDAHIYLNHMDQVKQVLANDPYPLPQLQLNDAIKDIDDFTFDDIKLINYKSHGIIKAEVSV